MRMYYFAQVLLPPERSEYDKKWGSLQPEVRQLKMQLLRQEGFRHFWKWRWRERMNGRIARVQT